MQNLESEYSRRIGSLEVEVAHLKSEAQAREELIRAGGGLSPLLDSTVPSVLSATGE